MKITYFMIIMSFLNIFSILQGMEVPPEDQSVIPFDKDTDLKEIILLAQILKTHESESFEKYMESPNFTTFVCKKDEEIAGFINYIVLDVQKKMGKFGLCGLINLLVVKEKYRQKGYGTLLMKNALHDLHNRGIQNCATNTYDNESCRKLYEKCGFVSRIWKPNVLYYYKIDAEVNVPHIGQATNEELDKIGPMIDESV